MTNDHNNAFSCWLDLFRWTSSVAVLIAHMALFTLPPYYATTDHPIIFTGFSFLTGFAHQAVMVFFVLSGYLVGGSFLKSLAADRYDFRDYALKRLVRLWIVIIPTLVLSYAMAAISIHGLGNDSFPPYVNYQAEKMSFLSFLGTLAFTQTFAVKAFAFNAPLWSLSNEFIYYFAFPFLFLLVFRSSGKLRFFLIGVCLAVLAIISYFQFSGSSILPYFAVWIFGVIAAQVKRNTLSIPVWQAFVAFAVILVATRFIMIGDFEIQKPVQLFFIDVIVGLSFMQLLISMRFSQIFMPPLPALHKRLAAFSFSLYCLHFPLTIFMSSVLFAYNGSGYVMPPGQPSTWIIISIFLAVNIAVAFLMAEGTERHTDRLRHYISEKLRLKVYRRT